MLPIFMYHRIAHVAPEEDPRGLAVTPAMFEKQMAALHAKGYQCLRFEEAALRWQQRRPQPANSFVLTFDDGYRDLRTDVAPILERFGFSATVFLVTDYVGQTNAWEKTGPSTIPILDWDEIYDLDQGCFDFGSHTATHPRLRTLSNEAVEEEVRRSRATLETRLDRPVTLFAYPYGNHDGRVRRIVSRAGYVAACGVDRGVWHRYNVWRIECGAEDTPRSILWKARGLNYLYYSFREHTALGRGLRSIWHRFKDPWRRNVVTEERH